MSLLKCRMVVSNKIVLATAIVVPTLFFGCSPEPLKQVAKQTNDVTVGSNEEVVARPPSTLNPSTKNPDSNPPAVPQGSSTNGRASTDPEPLLVDWTNPSAVLLLTGEQHGYFEPCGCSVNQLGGMARRADLVRILTEERKWQLSGLDVGGNPKRNRRQDQIKYLTLLDGLKVLNYGAVALGLEELELGADFILQQQVVDPEEAKKALGLLGANVSLYDPPLEGWPLAFRIVDIGSIKVGVTSVVGLSHRERIAPAGAMTNITISDPVDVLPKVIASLQEQKPDFLVLLSHGNLQEARVLAEKFPEFQILLTAGGPEEPDKKPVVVGKTWILQAGHKGKRVGVLGYFKDQNPPLFRYDIVELDQTRFKNDSRMRDLMKSYQQNLIDEGISTSAELVLPHPSGHTFVGADKCGECHTKAFEHWKSTPHADAFHSLIKGRHGDDPNDPISRIHDPECLSCHVTGWEPQQMLRYDSGYVSEALSKGLLNQQCENCHGPGSLHVKVQDRLATDSTSVSASDAEKSLASVRRTVEQARSGDCAKCHDSDNDPKFTPDAFDKYWEKVKHPWRD